eukprot:CAMPEP_0184071262 /NCGR_PEP_ID=MMETSP0957-20130417/53765_1 /TAXON_ID=627963 /ORGANISM="Aplanochytrium sp, Strain PBS07" /LENGTH=279 /DNA_ID=CAMNT_0026371689 /DNA_START=42 /DNA_END=881 /DNA_ORIENTATION=-
MDSGGGVAGKVMIIPGEGGYTDLGTVEEQGGGLARMGTVKLESSAKRARFVVENVVPGLIALAVLVVFIFATVVEIQKNKEDLNLDFRALRFFLIPVSLSFLLIASFMYCGCGAMTSGCCIISDHDNVYHPKGRKYYLFSLRGLELADLVSDAASVILIFSDFVPVWQGILISSIALSAILNGYNIRVLSKDDSWQGRKKRIATSFAIMSVEDIIIIPVSYLYLFEVDAEIDSNSEFGFKVELVAVGLSLGVGVLLLVVRTALAVHHFSCSKPIESDLV